MKETNSYMKSANHLRYEVIQRCVNMKKRKERAVTEHENYLDKHFLNIYQDLLIL